MSIRTMVTINFLTMSLVSAANVLSAPVETRLADGGVALQQVVVAAGSSAPVRAVAGELADYLGRIAGTNFEVVEGDGATGIAVGVDTDFPALGEVVDFNADDPFRRDDYLLRSHAKGAWLIGASERAASHAVWDFLHRLGYRLQNIEPQKA